MEAKVNLHTRAVHSGDRKRTGSWVPVTTPIHTATSYFYDDVGDLDRSFEGTLIGPSYARHGNPTNEALEELIADLEGGSGALACASGMSAVQLAILAALTDRRRVLLAANDLYGATINMLMKVLEPAGIETHFVDFNDPAAVEAAVAAHKPGAMLMETISNPLLRVAPLDRIGEIAKRTDTQLVVDSTFSTPLVLRPLEHGATFVVHSVTKYLAGHGDVLGGIVVSTPDQMPFLRSLAKATGPLLGPFEAYLTMRGVKTFPLRMERQCANAVATAKALAAHPSVEKVNFPGNADHPDAATAARLFAPGLFGAMISFQIRENGAASRDRIFRFMNALKMVVPATSLGDVQTMVLYPVISSHRELAPKHRARLGIQDNLVRLSVGIEAAEDIIADLDQALRA